MSKLQALSNSLQKLSTPSKKPVADAVTYSVQFENSESGVNRLPKGIDRSGKEVLKTATPQYFIPSKLLLLPKAVLADSEEGQTEMTNILGVTPALKEEKNNYATSQVLLDSFTRALKASKINEATLAQISKAITEGKKGIPSVMLPLELAGEKTSTSWEAGNFRFLTEFFNPLSAAFIPDMVHRVSNDKGQVGADHLAYEALKSHHSSKVKGYLDSLETPRLKKDISSGQEVKETSWSCKEGRGILPTMVLVCYVINLTELVKTGKIPESPELCILKVRPFKLDQAIPSHLILNSYKAAKEAYAKTNAADLAKFYGVSKEAALEHFKNLDTDLPWGSYWMLNIVKEGDPKNPSKTTYTTSLEVYNTAEPDFIKGELDDIYNNFVSLKNDAITPSIISPEVVENTLDKMLSYIAENPLTETLYLPSMEDVVNAYNDAVTTTLSEDTGLNNPVQVSLNAQGRYKIEMVSPSLAETALKKPNESSETLSADISALKKFLSESPAFSSENLADIMQAYFTANPDVPATESTDTLFGFLEGSIEAISDEIIKENRDLIKFIKDNPLV